MGGLALRRLDPFEALAEISRFAAGLVQRVPKKTSIAKSDLLNSTAAQGDCSWYGFYVNGSVGHVATRYLLIIISI